MPRLWLLTGLLLERTGGGVGERGGTEEGEEQPAGARRRLKGKLKERSGGSGGLVEGSDGAVVGLRPDRRRGAARSCLVEGSGAAVVWRRVAEGTARAAVIWWRPAVGDPEMLVAAQWELG